MRLVTAVAVLAGCSSRPPAIFAGVSSIALHGNVLYADGSPAARAPVQFSLLATGEDLFSGSPICGPGDAHAQGLQNVLVLTGPGGSFSFEAPMGGFVRATDETCPMPPGAASNIARVDLRAQADADFTSCLPYCRRHPEETCYADCAARGQKFVWTTSLLTAEDARAPKGIHFDMLGPPLAGAPVSEPALPDLLVDGEAARNSLRISEEDFASTACALEDACIGAPGTRTLLRFDGDIENLGAGDLRIGAPENNPLFSYSACHRHYHLGNIMTFELFDETGAPAIGDQGRVVVRKQGFCMTGIQQIAGDSPNPYDCGDQGLAAGWEDIYDSNLGCQYLDVTGVAGGDYALRITVNPSRTFPESDFDNNSAIIPVSLP